MSFTIPLTLEPWKSHPIHKSGRPASHDPGWQPPAPGMFSAVSPQDKRVLLGVCAGCGSVTPLCRGSSVPTASPAAGGRKPSLCWGRCQVLGAQAAELGLFMGPEACWLRNAGSWLSWQELPVLGSAVPRCRPQPPSSSQSYLGAEGSGSRVPSAGTWG